eukprot:TRINITY_DN7806_c1_g1_i2.p1 TRINITY_DN7806_c1_g1~~TRINITY_DN7806_c1_g1_i2.p1  ORF type:complete len:901 (+),score=205.08 TRINITY_DN7806_c1_g1_i2:216-2705(+)
MASEAGRRMRLNVTALGSDGAELSKFLVVIDEEVGMQQLLEKVQRVLRRDGLPPSVDRVLNSSRAMLPHDELVGDMLRDGEEIFAVVGGHGGAGTFPPVPAVASNASPAPLRQQPVAAAPVMFAAGGLPSAEAMGYQADAPMRAAVALPPELFQADSDESEEEAVEEVEPPPAIMDYPPAPCALRGGNGELVPGPAEHLACDFQAHHIARVDHPCEPIQPNTYDNDWLVENFTPKLREFLLEHFHEDMITEPKYVPSIGKFVGARFYQACGSFVSVFMRPQTVVGSDPNMTMPVHYNVPKADIHAFQARAEKMIDTAQQHLDLFRAASGALRTMLQKGMGEGDQVETHLPHSYQALDEVEGAMQEVDSPLFPKIDGQYPVFIVDTSGAVGQHLGLVKGALKRALQAHVAAKVGFQLIHFHPQTGEPFRWAQQIVPPTDRALQAAEDWIDNLAPCHECDEIHIISSGQNDKAQTDAVIDGIRTLNRRVVAIYTVGIDPDPHAELLLKKISESNNGEFTLRSFGNTWKGFTAHDAKWTSWRTNLVNEKSKQLADSFKKQRMTIGSQLQIIEVMQREEKQKEQNWHEEWKCAQRLLRSSEHLRSSASDVDGVRELERRTARTLSARVGGGFAYLTDEVDLGLEALFEHRSALPWTATSETTASGPKLPVWDSCQGRAPRFPPACGGAAASTLSAAMAAGQSMAAPSRGARAASGGSRSRRSAPGSSNPWAPGSSAGAMRRNAPPQASARGPSRAASADRAAGPRAASPSGAAKRRGRGKTPPPSRERRRQETSAPAMAPPPPAPPAVAGGGAAEAAFELPPVEPVLQRRWSF